MEISEFTMCSEEINLKMFLGLISLEPKQYFMSLLDGEDIYGTKNIHSKSEFLYKKQQHMLVGQAGVVQIISQVKTEGPSYVKDHIAGIITVRFYHKYKEWDISYWKDYFPLALELSNISWDREIMNIITSKNIFTIKPFELSCVFFARGVIGKRTW